MDVSQARLRFAIAGLAIGIAVALISTRVMASLLYGVTSADPLTYAVVAVVLGGIFLGMAWQLRRSPTRRNAGVLFHYSLLYLALLFVAAAVGSVI